MSFLNKKLIGYSEKSFGLDLSDLSVKIVDLEEKGGMSRIASFGCASIAPGGIKDGEVAKRDLVTQAIKKALSACGPKKIKTKRVICSIPETKGFLRIVSLPKMKEEEVKEAIKWEIEANIPMSIDQVYYDWQVLDKKITKDIEKMDVLVTAASKKIIDELLATLEMAGLKPVGLEIESIAQAQSLVKEDDKNTNFVIDLGDRRTSFLIMVGNTPCFTSSIPLSGSSITDSISKVLNMSFGDAEKIKFNYGIGSFSQQDYLFKAVEPVLENLVSQIQKSIDFYLTELWYSSAIDRIIICGGGSNTKGIIPYLSRKLGKDVELGNPWINFDQKRIPAIERKQSVQYSTAIGLALCGLYKEEY